MTILKNFANIQRHIILQCELRGCCLSGGKLTQTNCENFHPAHSTKKWED